MSGGESVPVYEKSVGLVDTHARISHFLEKKGSREYILRHPQSVSNDFTELAPGMTFSSSKDLTAFEPYSYKVRSFPKSGPNDIPCKIPNDDELLKCSGVHQRARGVLEETLRVLLLLIVSEE
ncbi:hypothetical protein G5I_03693 [Acromyrmex echinatior]|uniref:Uncharacterized protein n=1 Tax=Acromyrmex echinatior TaxID=103372 RepID=F4WDN9_ACREC|nr:hypothetical protein G5I_03693 [Acromyrmex echinatior]